MSPSIHHRYDTEAKRPVANSSLIARVRAISSRRADSHALTRLLRAAGLLLFIFLAGTVGYYVICRGEYGWLTCAYMTLITLTTVGFGETIPVTGHPERMVLTIGLVILGMGIMLYFVSQLTAFVVDGELRDMISQRSMRKDINKLSNHFIIAGMGGTGRHVLDEILKSDRACLLIDHSPETLAVMLEKIEHVHQRSVPSIVGDATEDHVLMEAGIERAQGIVFTLGTDRDNLFATITARSLNPDLRIVTRGENPRSEQKFLRAGATSIIFTNVLGGMRMAAEVIRPEVTGFLDLMMHQHGEVRRIEELEIPPHSPLAGKTLREADLRAHADALVVAIYDRAQDAYKFNPGPNCALEAGNKLIVLTLIHDVPKIEKLLRG